MTKAETIINEAVNVVRKIFSATGVFHPIVHCINATGEETVFPLPQLANKDEWAAFMRFILQFQQAVAYVFINEGWLRRHPADASREEINRIVARGLEHDPDRQEVVIFIGEDDHGSITASMPTIRPDNMANPISAN